MSDADAAPLSIERVELQRALIISPRGLGDMRWRDLAAEFRRRAIDLPLERLEGVDKNRADCAKCAHAPLIMDERPPQARRRVADAQDLSVWDDCFAQKDFAKRRLAEGRGIQIGAYCCAISHILAWRRVAELNETCLVLEDDVAPRAEWSTTIDWPSSADMLVIWSDYMHRYIEERAENGRRFLRLLSYDACKREGVDADRLPLNGALLAYALKPAGARRLLEEFLPLEQPRLLDEALFNIWDPPDFKIYALAKGESLVKNTSTPLVNPSLIGYRRLWIKSLIFRLAYSRFRFALKPVIWSRDAFIRLRRAYRRARRRRRSIVD